MEDQPMNKDMDKTLQQLCRHEHMKPFVSVAGKRVWGEDRCYIDWTSNVINAHYIKVIKYYCPSCGAIIHAPSDIEGEET
jgi:hypothetical protein